MDGDGVPASESKPSGRGEPTRSIAKRFAAIGFLAGGSVVLCYGFIRAFPPPLPPGAAHCGNEIMAGWFLMLIGAPFVAAVSSLVALGIGVLLDSLRNRSAAQRASRVSWARDK
jgi:hypothetical protein